MWQEEKGHGQDNLKTADPPAFWPRLIYSFVLYFPHKAAGILSNFRALQSNPGERASSQVLTQK